MLKFLFDLIKQFIVRFKLRNKVKISSSAKVYRCFFEGYNSVKSNVVLSDSEIGLCSYINDKSDVKSTKIGRFCSIADNVSVVLGNHPTNTFVSTFPSFYYDTTSQLGYTFHLGGPLFDSIYKYPLGQNKYQVIIGNDVWIGSHVTIIGGVCIGDGAIIAAGSVVTKDVEPYSIYGGVPAKFIKKRFSDDQISKLLENKWWTLPIDIIKSNYLNYSNINSFL